MAYVLIKSQTASNSASVDFVNGASDVVFDSTYKEYVITYTNYSPATDERQLHFQVDTGTATTYGQNTTTATAYAGNREDSGWNELGAPDAGNGNDSGKIKLTYSGEATHAGYNSSGELRLFDPAGGTFMKMWENRSITSYTGNNSAAQTYAVDYYSSGYVHQTSALTRIQFVAATSFGSTSGNIATGIFTLYGIT